MAQVWDAVSSQPSYRRSQPKCPKGKAGEGRTSFLPHGHLILPPWIRGARGAAREGKDRAAWSCVPATHGTSWTPSQALRPLAAFWLQET